MAVRIYGTIGPACENRKVLSEMFRAGMTGVRLNLSHVSLNESRDALDAVCAAAEENDIVPEILIDMQGPEMRIGELPEEGLALSAGECIRMDRDLPLKEEVIVALKMGDKVFLDDGKIELDVVSVGYDGGGRTVLAEVIRGGLLLSRKSIAIKGKDFGLPALTERDIENIGLAAERGVTGVMQPFVRDSGDLKAVREALDAAGGKNIRLLAKVESLKGVENLAEFMDHADEIVIARGDLGNAMPLWKLPGLQKRIAAMCRDKDKDFMVVTQMLASMEHSPVPTRAEVSDIYNAVLDGAASVMVTGETAVGDYPVEVIKYLKLVAAEAERGLKYGA